MNKEKKKIEKIDFKKSFENIFSGELKIYETQLDLDEIITSEYDLSEINLKDIIDVSRLQSLMDDFYHLTNIGIALIDMEGKVLVATGWQDICTKFHRVHPKTEKRCIESDIYLTQDVEPGEYLIYKCKNNLWDMATPIRVWNTRVGTLFLGQFFFEDEDVNREFFVNQAEKYDFDKKEYLDALDSVPRWSKETVDTVMSFYTKFASMISELSFKNLLLKKLIKDQQLKEQKLRESKSQLKDSVKQAEFYKDLLAHDIANKLSNVYSSIQLIDMFDNIVDNIDKVEDLMQTIKEEVREGKNIISNVRKLSKVKDKEVPKHAVQVKKVLKSAIKHASVRIQRKKSKISTSFPEKEILVQGGDLLIDAFENILINGAIHNESEVVKLWIELSVVNGKVKIEFKDNGIGIPDERKKRLFQKSYQRTSESGGMGIGLSLVKNIVDTYDGEIRVENRIESDYSKGSNFIIILNRK